MSCCSTRSIALLSMVVGSLLMGCAVKMEAVRYPPFIDPTDPAGNVKNLLVLPFETTAGHEEAGRSLAASLAKRLKEDKTYRRVEDWKQITRVGGRRDLMALMKCSLGRGLEALRQYGRYDAVLVGKVDRFGTTSAATTSTYPVPEYTNGRWSVRFVTEHRTRVDAVAAVSARLYRIRDGKLLHETPGSVTGHHESTSASPRSCLQEASDVAVEGLRAEFAVTRQSVKLDKDTLQTARKSTDGSWDFTNRFRVSDGQVFVVLRLPDACDRNRFRLAISRADRPEIIASRSLTWHRGQHAGAAFAFDLRDVCRQGGGSGQDAARFLCGTEPKLEAEFEIEDRALSREARAAHQHEPPAQLHRRRTVGMATTFGSSSQ